MKQSVIFSAYQTLESFSENDKFSYSVLWDLFQLKTTLKPHVDFFNERMDVIKQKYLPMANDKGELSGEPLTQYLDEVNELGNMDVKIKIDKPTLSLKDMPGITIKIMDSLNAFVNFSKE